VHRVLRPIALAGIGAGLLSNYWVLEAWLAEHSDLNSGWISDLASRSEATGWRFLALGVASGLAIAGFALALRRCELPRRGVWALFAVGLLTALAAAAPLSCGEELDPSCTPTHDLLDLLHSLATGGEIVATAIAFALLGLGLLRRRPPWVGWATLGVGAAWLVLTLLTGVAYYGDGLDSAGGALQRANQVLFGAWLALLGLLAARRERSP